MGTPPGPAHPARLFNSWEYVRIIIIKTGMIRRIHAFYYVFYFCRFWGWFPLGSLRPDLYQLPEEPSEWALPKGSDVRLWFALRYQDEREQLVVSLLRAANLPSRCQGNITLVKLQLLPSDERRLRQAKAKRKGRHPTFNDSFVFQVGNFFLRFYCSNYAIDLPPLDRFNCYVCEF